MENDMSKWMVYTKKADFKAIGERYGIDQVVARIIRNRDVCGEEKIEMYLNGTEDNLYSAHLLKDADLAVDIIMEKIRQKRHIRIVGDYDIDGVCSVTILLKGLKAAGALVDYTVPDRVADGYGINKNIIDRALSDGVDTIITCDNGIAAIPQINYAKDNNMTVIVTDHHDIPFKEENGSKVFLKSNADAIVNPKQEECSYPFKMLCGAAVAYKVISILYERLSLPDSDLLQYRQLAAVATIGDVVDLTDENRVLVKHGLATMEKTKNTGLRALIDVCQIDISALSSYHIGFVIGPCLNAGGRLETAKLAVELLIEDNPGEARVRAEKLKELNEERKAMTENEAAKAIDMVENTALSEDKVLVVYLPECHESIAGIIAGRLKEYFYRPAFVITDAAEGAKGSGRSIEGYNMFEEITRCGYLLNKFGGHPMAAGISLDKENIEEFRWQLNHNQTLTEEQLTPVTWIDVPMPLGYVKFSLIEQLKCLEPFGKGNEKPVFADRNLTVRQASITGKNKNVLKLVLEDENAYSYDAVMFRADALNVPLRGQKISIVYYPSINEYNGNKTIQFVVSEWRV
jgi:single-stranded-DNA-specific exonuclease